MTTTPRIPTSDEIGAATSAAALAILTEAATSARVDGAYYVLDTMAGDPAKRIISGPFAKSWDAELDRRERNIAGDCVVVVYRAERHRYEAASLVQAVAEGTFS